MSHPDSKFKSFKLTLSVPDYMFLYDSSQGSLMSPFIFNIFSNDLLLLLEKKCHVFNYADDTSILCKHRDYDFAYNDLLSAASTMIHWYKMNCMQANPEKFQFIIFDKERQPRTLQLNHNVTIQSVSNVKLLGVNCYSR